MVSAKDIILEVLRIMSVKGGVGKIIEYGGEGAAHTFGSRARDHHEYGRRTGRHHVGVPGG